MAVDKLHYLATIKERLKQMHMNIDFIGNTCTSMKISLQLIMPQNVCQVPLHKDSNRSNVLIFPFCTRYICITIKTTIV